MARSQTSWVRSATRSLPRRSYRLWPVATQNGDGERDKRFGNEPHSPAMPEHSAIVLARALEFTLRPISLRIGRTTSRIPSGNAECPGICAARYLRAGNATPKSPSPPEHRTSPPIDRRGGRGSWILPRVQPPARRSATPRRRQREGFDGASGLCLTTSREFSKVRKNGYRLQ